MGNATTAIRLGYQLKLAFEIQSSLANDRKNFMRTVWSKDQGFGLRMHWEGWTMGRQVFYLLWRDLGLHISEFMGATCAYDADEVL